MKLLMARSAAIALAVALSGCGTSGSADEQAKAEQLVKETDSAGVAEGLTVQTAESLYGTSAPQICDALDAGIGSAASMLLTGNPSGRRPKLVTTDAVTYAGLVVSVYCPDQTKAFDDLLADIDPTEPTS
jgi:hypothetical protein